MQRTHKCMCALTSHGRGRGPAVGGADYAILALRQGEECGISLCILHRQGDGQSTLHLSSYNGQVRGGGDRCEGALC